MTTAQPQRKKLIEVALPLDEINAACKADKDRKSGTIRNLHKWFAPMPLPAWRALLFAALVDDPGDDEKRAYLLDVIKRLVANGADLPDSLAVDEARRIIAQQFPDGVPQVFDPFCGGGSTLVEGQRLGLPTFGSDLNPVPALITRTLTEVLPKVHGRRAISTTSKDAARPSATQSNEAELSLIPALAAVAGFEGLQGLIQDVVAYAGRVQRRVDTALANYFYRESNERPIAWVWARTAHCTNPACGAETILTTSWWLSKKPGALAWIEPRISGQTITLAVVESRIGSAPKPPKEGRGAAFVCLVCQQVIDTGAISAQGASGGLGLRMLAVATEVKGKRRYRAPSQADEAAASRVERPDRAPDDVPVGDGGSRDRFGLMTQADLYTDRQLLTLCTFADEIAATRGEIIADGGDEAWAAAVVTILGLGLGGLAMASSSQSRWRERNVESKAEPAFGRNDLPMTWDFAETYYASESVGDWLSIVRRAAVTAAKWSLDGDGTVLRADARTSKLERPGLVATDPPYFDAIGYADLSDYFYVWHRRALRAVHPDLYATLAAPKSGELTALPTHHGNSREAARTYFIEGFTQTFRNLQESLAPDLPMLVVYASKEQSGGGDEQTRWSSILTAMVQADLQIVGTWPIHGTGSSRMIGQGTNSVATYVVMICRPRIATAGSCSLADFNRALRRELRPAVHDFQSAGILPVDLAQAAMGPGMQVYSRYRQVVDQTGKKVPVSTALRLISAALGEVLDEQEGELDPYSRLAVAWWEKHGWIAAPFGEADQLARPQGISVDDVVRAGVVHYPKPGFVAVLGNDALDRAWTVSQDGMPTAWEAVHHLADRLISGGGAMEAGRLMADLGTLRDPAQALVYRLHDIAAKKNRTKDQERYNALIGSWSDLLAISAEEKDGLF